MPRVKLALSLVLYARETRPLSVILNCSWSQYCFTLKNLGGESYLGKADRVDLVLGRNLDASGAAGLGVESSLDAGLNGWVDTVVVAGGKEGEAVGGGEAEAIHGGLVSKRSSVAGKRRLLDV